jgi:di/tripeptidase
VYRRILGPVCDNEKENWRILTDKEIYAIVKKTYHNRDNKATQITWVGAGTENGRK